MGGMNRRGAETFIMNVYRKIDKNLVQFDFLVYEDAKQDYEDEIVALGGRVIHISCAKGVRAIKSIPMIREVIRNYGPYKAIHAQTLFNICYSMIAANSFPEIVRISHSHNTQNQFNPKMFVRAYEWISTHIIRRYTQVMLACGEEAGLFLFGEKFRKDGIVMNNGIDLNVHAVKNMEACVKIKKEYGLEGKLVIGSVARFNEVKNHIFMVKIAESLKIIGADFKMLFVGNGGLQELIQKQVEEANLQNEVIFTGLRNDINDIMHTLDVFLMPSHFEGNPVTLVEAQAAGVPCVITDIITDKMNMGLGLIHKCSLNESPGKWANMILLASTNKCNDLKLIRKQILNSGYDAQTTANKLQSIYLK